MIVLYGNSTGAVGPPVPAGWSLCAESVCAPGLSNVKLRRLIRTPQVLTGSVPVPRERILFAGLVPEYPGLYQINLIVPEGVARGPEVPFSVCPAGAPQPRSTLTSVAIG